MSGTGLRIRDQKKPTRKKKKKNQSSEPKQSKFLFVYIVSETLACIKSLEGLEENRLCCLLSV